jgi:hypothetical protein
MWCQVSSVLMVMAAAYYEYDARLGRRLLGHCWQLRCRRRQCCHRQIALATAESNLTGGSATFAAICLNPVRQQPNLPGLEMPATTNGNVLSARFQSLTWFDGNKSWQRAIGPAAQPKSQTCGCPHSRNSSLTHGAAAQLSFKRRRAAHRPTCRHQHHRHKFDRSPTTCRFHMAESALAHNNQQPMQSITVPTVCSFVTASLVTKAQHGAEILRAAHTHVQIFRPKISYLGE